MSTEMEAEVDEIEIEVHTQKVSGKEKPPKAKKYIIRVDKTKFTVEVSSMTGREILSLAGKTPVEQYKLTQKMHGGAAKTINLDDPVNFTEPGVERFMTLKRDQTEG
jgi:hypothetical protein